MGCMFALLCGRNPGACCHECEVDCWHQCSQDKEGCDFYDSSGDSKCCTNVDCVRDREK